MGLGSLLTATKGSGAEGLITDALGIKSLRDLGVGGKIVRKATAPVDNATNNDPLSVGVFCIDVSSDDVYICYAWSAANNHDWKKIGAST